MVGLIVSMGIIIETGCKCIPWWVVEMWTRGMITCMYIIPSSNIVVVLMVHLQQFKTSYHMQLQCNSCKSQTWLTTYVCIMCINYQIEDSFSIHLQL
jgi:hypothetical protein